MKGRIQYSLSDSQLTNSCLTGSHSFLHYHISYLQVIIVGHVNCYILRGIQQALDKYLSNECVGDTSSQQVWVHETPGNPQVQMQGLSVEGFVGFRWGSKRYLRLLFSVRQVAFFNQVLGTWKNFMPINLAAVI